jgi:hypothetical protein
MDTSYIALFGAAKTTTAISSGAMFVLKRER